MPNPILLRALASAFLNGSSSDEIVARAERLLGRSRSWLPPLAERHLAEPRSRIGAIVAFLRSDADFLKHAHEITIQHWIADPPTMRSAPWNLPALPTLGDLADFLGVTPTELDWYADLKSLLWKDPEPRLSHYHYTLLKKSFGAVRLIEAPKPNLKSIQRKILKAILNRVPARDAVHGFVRARSIKTFAAPHTGQPVVLRMDLADFFPSFSRSRIQAFFRTIGYPESVADLLGGLCTTITPRRIIRHELYDRPHLPQGAPTSPALANACMYRVDCRLTGYAEAAGARYTRYADDLAFSGELAARFAIHIAAILFEEGFIVNHRKTRLMRQGVRQHLAGVVANQHVNVIRADYDRLKAILTNCIRLGPESQNREHHPDFRAHLEGKISFVRMINPSKARRLQGLFSQIRWR